ncbi:unnamed protein product [Adineta ricciae]|uniref:Uncharacterized protein n=1 Tax=Adineta ricciae TaxID=249248 RepID=A0A815IWE6_ADIRI|nr:unnamed protein product [Adineta ricciae]CAF1374274.1 unnamed protein product [Adineta ricciae]
MMMIKLIKLLCTKLIELNIFKSRDIGGNIDRITAKRYGQCATRLYLALFLSGLIILVFYTVIHPHTVIKNFNKPLFSDYNHIREIYGDELKCSCSKIASKYNQFVEIKSVLHPICGKEFVSEKWRMDLVSGLHPNLAAYGDRDYRRFLSAHLQYLQGLCQLSQKSVDNTINEYVTSLLVTVQLLSETDFQNQLNASIEHSRLNAPLLFSRCLFFIQNNFRANAFLSIYGTDFKFPIESQSYTGYLYAEPVIYDNGCSCEMSSNCTTQATFIETDSSKIISVLGMKMGCTPTESFLASTLECFYNQSCLDFIQQYTNYSNSLTPLSTTILSRFSQNTTITELIRHLFIEKWSTKINYSSYYEQCSPSLCSYISVENFDIIYSITVILSIQGGLTIVLKWLCPKLVQTGSKIYHFRKKRITSIHPKDSLAISSQVSTNRIIQNTTSVVTERPINLASQNNLIPHNRLFFKIVFVIIVLCMLGGIVMFSIYYTRQDLTTEVTMTDNLNTTIGTIISTSIGTSTESICQPKFDYIFINASCYYFDDVDAAIAVDVNADDKFDVIFYCPPEQTLNILLGKGNNGTFEKPNIYPFDNNALVSQILSGDVNNDSQIDLILVYRISSDDQSYFGILLGNGNGTFQIESMQSIATTGTPKKTLFVDLNNDKLLDIISANTGDNLQIIYGNDSETFLSPLTLHIGYDGGSEGLVIGDFNNDSYMDIAVLHERDLHIHVFFASVNRSVWLHKWFFTTIRTYDGTIVSGDFDSDNGTDIVFLTMYYEYFSKLYRYKNGTFHTDEHTFSTMEDQKSINLAVVGDLNSDSYLDITIIGKYSHLIYSLLGTRSEKFEIHQILDVDEYQHRTWIDIIDINHDGCPDIITLTRFADLYHQMLEIFFNTCVCYTR